MISQSPSPAVVGKLNRAEEKLDSVNVAALQAAIEQNRRIVLENNPITIDHKWSKETPVPAHLIQYVDEGVVASKIIMTFKPDVYILLTAVQRAASGNEGSWDIPKWRFILGADGQDRSHQRSWRRDSFLHQGS